MLRALDEDRLREALALAGQSVGLSDPNPRVGCVIGHEDGRVLGRGFTQQAGGPHAEVMALRDAAAQGLEPRGATAWVTLEPCAHHGRTPPCADALLAAGIARVVAAVEDPFHAVAGRGLQRLRAAGVAVQVAEGELARAAVELNIGFFSRVRRGRPWVRLKVACSLDGRTALPGGESQWITGPEARADGHAWRRRAGAVLTGIGTVLADDPRLDVRLVPTARQPLRAVLDTTLRLPPASALARAPGLVVYTASADPQRSAVLAGQGVRLVQVPSQPGRGLSLQAVSEDLAAQGVNELHVEAGPCLTGAWLASGLADELLLYLAPRLLGAGPGIAQLPPLPGLAAAESLELVDTARVGPDLRLRLRRLPDPSRSWSIAAD
jgi:diaminohydroxyphosphoribosylaminopyrimidine deaminase/5-amino-6-(5-phosphoribosylamino)uracil reductase